MDPFGALGYGEIQRTWLYPHALCEARRIPRVLPKRSRKKFTEKGEERGHLQRWREVGATTPTLRGADWRSFHLVHHVTLYWVIFLWCQQLVSCVLPSLTLICLWKSKSELCIWIHMLQNRQQNWKQAQWVSNNHEKGTQWTLGHTLGHEPGGNGETRTSQPHSTGRASETSGSHEAWFLSSLFAS